MAISPLQTAGTTTVTILLILHLLVPTSQPTTSSVFTELLILESQSDSGVIHLNETLLEQILSLPTPRPFHFIVFFDAKMLRSRTELGLTQLISEYSIASSSFHANNKRTSSSSHLFFSIIEYEKSRSSFGLFGVNAVPHVRMVPPSAKDLKTESLSMDNGGYSGDAESFVLFIQSTTDFTVGPIKRPPVLSKSMILIISAAILLSVPVMIKKYMSGNTFLHNQNVWMAGAIFVYFFSVSGTMFNIIRKMPMVIRNQRDPTKMVLFYKGSGMQLGAEGFIVGFLYTVVGILLAVMTHVLVRFNNKSLQRFLMLGAILVSVWAINMLVYLDNWKTGYRIWSYWPSARPSRVYDGEEFG